MLPPNSLSVCAERLKCSPLAMERTYLSFVMRLASSAIFCWPCAVCSSRRGSTSGKSPSSIQANVYVHKTKPSFICAFDLGVHSH